MSFVSVQDGTHLYYEEMGKGEPLLLLSGQGLDHTFWDGIRDDFATRFRVIVYDQRGTGQSDKPRSPPYSTRGFARDAVELLDQLGIKRAHAYGHSTGGCVCHWLGIDHGKRIGALVLGASTPGNAHGVLRTAEVEALWTHPPTDPAEAFKALSLLFFSPDWIKANTDFLKEMKVAEIPDYARLMHYQAGEGHETWDLLPEIRSPTLVIHGSMDQLVPAKNANLVAERIPGAELYIIKGARHIYTLEFREESSRVINEFLSRHPIEG